MNKCKLGGYMNKKFAALLGIIFLISSVITPAEACTSFLLKTKDGGIVYGRTLEWGMFDLKSNLVMVPRRLSNVSDLGGGRKGIAWKNKYGYIAINALDLPLYMDGMNETGLIVGELYMPGFSEFQSFKAGEESSTISDVELSGYILAQFATVEEVRSALPKLRVISNPQTEKSFGAPVTLHLVVTDSSGSSVVIEYLKGQLHIYDNTVGVMTNSPSYDWHILNLRNYARLSPYAPAPGDTEVAGVNFTPFGGGAGMSGLPGDFTPPSRFVRAFFYVQSSLPLDDVDAAINQASRIVNNFDIPKGILREGTADNFQLGYTQWSVIGDIKNKRYYWWTEWNRQMRMVDLSKISFEGSKPVVIALDKVRAQNIEDRTGDFVSKDGKTN